MAEWVAARELLELAAVPGRVLVERVGLVEGSVRAPDRGLVGHVGSASGRSGTVGEVQGDG
ncbi:hypothetical protein ABJI51_07995 [Amycolatopsis sp. NEAU-NG30]|uniref:Uncharacterized protein n=1 Tax=Amycolatopsis melonis TaxID=3156488 RepID=A0ABV0L9M3_9PSEU